MSLPPPSSPEYGPYDVDPPVLGQINRPPRPRPSIFDSPPGSLGQINRPPRPRPRPSIFDSPPGSLGHGGRTEPDDTDYDAETDEEDDDDADVSEVGDAELRALLNDAKLSLSDHLLIDSYGGRTEPDDTDYDAETDEEDDDDDDDDMSEVSDAELRALLDDAQGSLPSNSKPIDIPESPPVPSTEYGGSEDYVRETDDESVATVSIDDEEVVIPDSQSFATASTRTPTTASIASTASTRMPIIIGETPPEQGSITESSFTETEILDHKHDATEKDVNDSLDLLAVMASSNREIAEDIVNEDDVDEDNLNKRLQALLEKAEDVDDVDAKDELNDVVDDDLQQEIEELMNELPEQPLPGVPSPDDDDDEGEQNINQDMMGLLFRLQKRLYNLEDQKDREIKNVQQENKQLRQDVKEFAMTVDESWKRLQQENKEDIKLVAEHVDENINALRESQEALREDVDRQGEINQEIAQFSNESRQWMQEYANNQDAINQHVMESRALLNALQEDVKQFVEEADDQLMVDLDEILEDLEEPDTDVKMQALPGPEQAKLPPPDREALPAPEREALPAPEREALPAPVREALPAPVREALPAPVREALPAPEQKALPAPEQKALPAPERKALDYTVFPPVRPLPNVEEVKNLPPIPDDDLLDYESEEAKELLSILRAQKRPRDMLSDELRLVKRPRTELIPNTPSPTILSPAARAEQMLLTLDDPQFNPRNLLRSSDPVEPVDLKQITVPSRALETKEPARAVPLLEYEESLKRPRLKRPHEEYDFTPQTTKRVRTLSLIERAMQLVPSNFDDEKCPVHEYFDNDLKPTQKFRDIILFVHNAISTDSTLTVEGKREAFVELNKRYTRLISDQTNSKSAECREKARKIRARGPKLNQLGQYLGMMNKSYKR